jgi:transposase-like protein
MIATGIVTPPWACGTLGSPVAKRMKKISYSGYRFPPEIIHQAIWLYLRFTLSLRDVEDLLAERGVALSYETVRRWVNHFGPMIAADLRKRRLKPHGTWHLDEVYLKIDGRMVYLCERSMLRARSSMCWSNPSETSTPR